MLMLSLIRPLAAMGAWLATWLVARSLNMPEPLVHDTGLFVSVQVKAIESRVGKALCPFRLLRQLRPLFPDGTGATRSQTTPSNQRREP
jgi:hypothetical protein